MNRYLRLFLCLPLLATTACAADAIAGPELAPEPAAEAVAQAAPELQAITLGEAVLAPGTVAIAPFEGCYRPINPEPKEPMYIVDGVVVLTLAGVDNADIESIEVIKGGAAASLYGIRATRGVILITTRGAPSLQR